MARAALRSPSPARPIALIAAVTALALTAFAAGAARAERPALDRARQVAPGAARVAAWDRARAEAARVAPADLGSLDSQFGVPTMLRAQAPAPDSARTPESAARAHLARFAPWYRLNTVDVANATLRHVHDSGRGGIIAAFTQSVAGVEVFGEEVKVLMDRRLGLLAITGHIAGGEAAGRGGVRAFARSAPEALAAALADFGGAKVDRAALHAGPAAEGGYETYTVGASPGTGAWRPQDERPIRIKRVLYHQPDGLVPAWYVELVGPNEAYAYLVSAEDGSLLSRRDQLSFDTFSYRVLADGTSQHAPYDGPQGTAMTPHPTGLPDRSMPGGFVPSSLVSWQNGPLSTNDPWLPSGATVTTGNNVDAYADLAAPDGFSAGDVRATTTSPGTFDRTYNPALAPNANSTQQMASVTSLFYATNWLHDWFYDAGFNESARNAQAVNYGRGGQEGDRLLAEALDYATTNNASMYVPADGASPRLQMHLYTYPDVTQCTVLSPANEAGAKTVAGVNTNPATFSVTGTVVRPVAGGWSTPGTVHFAMGTGTNYVSATDLDADGFPDLASANLNANTVSVRLNDGAAGFGAATTYAMGAGTATVMTGDFNQDGRPDLVSANSGSDNISVRLGTGAGAFGARTDFAAGVYPLAAQVGRLNADAVDDVVSANYSSNSVSVFLGNGVGGFAAKVDYPTGVGPTWVVIGDVNNDGARDLVTANSSANSISVLLGNGSGGFGARTDFAVGATPLSVSLADMNSDDKLDVVVANYAVSTVGLLLGNGTGGFAAMTTTAVLAAPVAVSTVDLNGDGIPDLEVACDNNSKVALMTNNGAGVLTAPANIAVGNLPFGLTVADVDRDGSVDILTANFTGSDVSVTWGSVNTPSGPCPPYTSWLANRIALVDSIPGCSVAQQVLAAQARGAIGALVRSPLASPAALGFGSAAVTIPVFVLGSQAAYNLEWEMRAGVPVTVSMVQGTPLARDGAMDHLRVAHEWGHLLTQRLVGNGSGLAWTPGGALSEGWSDFIALLANVRPEDAAVASNPAWAGAYATTGYSLQSAPLADNAYYYGTRRYPYSTNMSKNPLTFAFVGGGTLPPGVPHAANAEFWLPYGYHTAGEVWCTMLWECYAALLRDTGRLTFTQARDRMRQYLVASLQLTPAPPTFTEARDALLMVAYANDPADYELFGAAFAKRGMGVGAVSPDRYSADNSGVVESFVWGGDLTVESISLTDSVHTCDHDGYLDGGEAGLVTVTVRNRMTTAALSHTQATLTSGHPGLTFAAGGALALPPVAPGGTASATLEVSAAAAAGLQVQNVHVSVTDVGLAVPAPRLGDAAFWGNADDAFAAVDSAESRNSGWSFEHSGYGTAGGAWRRQATSLSPLDHVYFVADPGELQEQFLVSPPIQVGGGPFTFTFRHAHVFDADDIGAWDGGVVEISDDGGATWADLGAALTPGYNGALIDGVGNPIGGRAAFVGTSAGYPALGTVTANLGTTYAGKTVRVRFRFASDYSFGAIGWRVDDLAVTGATNLPFRTRVADLTPCSFLAVGDASPTELAFAVSGANPVRGDATFRFALPQPSHVRIGLYDVSGRRVARLADAEFGAGTFDARWHRSGGDAAVGPGVYFARMEAGGKVLQQRMVVLER